MRCLGAAQRFEREAGRLGSVDFEYGTAADLRRRLVLAQTLVDDLAQPVVVRPGQVFDFGHEFGLHPMHAA